MNDYSWYSSVSNMLNNLNWPSLHLRCRISRLQTFYKATYKLSALSIPSYFAPSQRFTRHFHPLHYQSWGNLVTCNLSYVIFTFQVKSNITKLLFSQVICNLIILLSEVILLFVYSSYVKLLFS